MLGTLRVMLVILICIIGMPSCMTGQTVSQQLFLSDPSQSLDLIDPVASGDNTTSQSELLGYFPTATVNFVNSFTGFDADNNSVFSLPNVQVLSGNDRLMLVGVSCKDARVTSVTYDGTGLNLVGYLDDTNVSTQAPVQSGDKSHVYIYSFINPPIGTANVIVTLDSDYDKGIVVGVNNFTGVNPSNPFGAFASAAYKDSGESPFDLNVPSAIGSMVFDVSTIRNGTQTINPSQTEIYNISSGDEIAGASSIKTATTTSTLMSWSSASSNEVARAGISINPGTNEDTTFTQSPALCNTLTIKASETITVSNYISIESGTMPVNPSISAELHYGATNIITLTNPTYDNASGLLTWTGVLGSDISIPAGEALALTVATTEPNVSFYIDYDSDTKPSNITFSRDSGVGIFPPDLPSEITGNTSPSLGAIETYSVENVPGVTYNWVLPAGWIQTAGGTTNSITVTVGSLTGTISVTPNNGFCNGDTRSLGLLEATKQLYLSDPSLALDRIDPVASGDNTTATSPILTVGTTVTVDLIATKDTGIKLKNDSNNYGSCTSIIIDRETTDSQRMLVQFDLSSLPPGAVVEYAELKMNCTSGADMDVSVFKIADADVWDEGTQCGASGASNWLQRTPTENWSAEGAIGPNSNSGTPLSTINVNSTGIQTWPVTCLVEDWVSGVSVNNGMALSVYQESGGMGNREAEYDTRESANPPILTVTYSLNAVSFRQTPEFCSPFTIKENTPITVETYVNVVNGTMPDNPDITAILKSSCSNTIITLTDPIFDATSNLITWSGSLDADNTIPAGDAITLVIGSNESGLEFEIEFDSLSKPSKVEFDTSTYIEIASFEVYDAPYPGGTAITTSEAGNAVYLRAEVTDPFGAYDITDLEIDMMGTPITPTLVNTTSCSNTYEYELFLNQTGSFSYRATAKEGLENAVTDKETAYLDVTSTQIDFDGVDDHIDFGDTHSFSGPFSVEAWFLQESTTSSGTILSKGDDKIGNKRGYVVALENNFPTVKWYDASGTLILNMVSPYAITNNKWYHISTTFDGARASLFIDGVKIAEENIAVTPSSGTEKFLLGALYDSDTPNTPKKYFDGFIDEVRIWDVALTEQQIHEMMNQEIETNGTKVRGKIIPLDISDDLLWENLIGYYTFTDDVAEDKSANNFFGVNRNTTTSQSQTAPLPYSTRIDNQNWNTADTWTNFTDVKTPNSIGIDGATSIDWNIVQVSHAINSGDKDITVLGLLLDTAGKELTMAEPSEPLDYNNSGQSLTVTKYLELDGIIDLVGESQLVQTSGSILDANSSGYIERDQQGTANSFNYNYWSSSVGPIGSSGPRGTASLNTNHTVQGVLLDGSLPDDGVFPKTINFQGSHTAADAGVTDPITISSYWLFKFNGANDDYNSWQNINETTSMLPGEGYTMKGSSGTESITTHQNYVYRGKPFNGDINLTLSLGNDRLVGNPYPSAIDAEKFIMDNISIADGGNNTNGNIFNGALYFWDHFGEENSHILGSYIGGYATRNLVGGVPAIANDELINATGESGIKIPGRYIPVNQGFFVSTSLDSGLTGITVIDGGDIIFNNSQRVYIPEEPLSSSFMKQAQKKGNEGIGFSNKSIDDDNSSDLRSLIRLKFDSSTGLHRQIMVALDDNATNSFDLGYDAPMLDKATEDFYWIIENTEFVIQAVNNFNSDQELPLGLVIDQSGSVNISIEMLENIPDDLVIYLYDTISDSYHDLRAHNYSTYLEPGQYLNRFKITFSNLDSLSIQDRELENLSIHYDYNKRKIVIVNPDLINLKALVIIDLNGRIIFDLELQQGSYNEYDLLELNSGAYIIRINTDDGPVIKKFIYN
ncbi:LamG-like jellyroll fold domain-containing protein [Winogradskyella alexanderae]|uniref:DNRLRE domain-containing protein n=1 Tax=Winogradskyella alexanderae TaxID=2877123 RepID=A0ABS7XMW6_9FLAO|nr:LamG-like jellyroll fold domain-containing protein [Winogradskyella alexanderae]MCA0131357.1 DNRLRE domain-containing protein [Winogradskyella alexanderae]